MGNDDSNWPFNGLTPGAYGFAMIDPPWSFKARSSKGITNRAPEAKYTTMSMDEIGALPIIDLLAKDAVVILWGTHPMLLQQIEIGQRWGLRYCTSGVWVKMRASGKQAFGTGFVLRSASEPFLVFKRGKPVVKRVVRTALIGELREHSRKPEIAYQQFERMMPDARRADIFSRETRPNWENWGHEATKYNEVAA